MDKSHPRSKENSPKLVANSRAESRNPTESSLRIRSDLLVASDAAEASLRFEGGSTLSVHSVGPGSHAFTHTRPHARASSCQEIIKSKNKSAVLYALLQSERR